MHNRLWFAAIVATTPILALSPVAFPHSNEPGCVRATAGIRKHQRYFMSLMRRHDDAADSTLGAHAVPHIKARQVKQVSDDDVCEKAAVAYSAVVQDESANRVHILHIGGRFVVTDPDYKPDDRYRVVTFDSSFTRPLALIAE